MKVVILFVATLCHYLQAQLSTFAKHNISSKLDHCYIENENHSLKLNLIQDNCPVGGYTR